MLRGALDAFARLDEKLTQQPAASVPCGFTKAGLPIGLHIVGKMFDDRTVLRASQAYEAATAWGEKRPKIK